MHFSGGYCNFYSERLMKESEHMSALQSWAPELVNFVKTPRRPIADGMCDIVIEKPTYIMKLDASMIILFYIVYEQVYILNMYLKFKHICSKYYLVMLLYN